MKPNHRLTQIYTRLTQILILLVTTPALSDLQWPLKEKTYLTGTFGEFRKNHIHAGIDISTHGKIGLPVYAGESGLLYRVKTQYLGFGKAVYIKLNDGKFLVYAHLGRFRPNIEKIVKEVQEKEGKYEVDIYQKEKIPIHKGDLIGYSGDTGGVSPHLHLELRDPDEKPINILKYGLSIYDNIPPRISGIAICDPLTTYAIATYSSKNIPPEIAISGKTGLAISTHDPSHGNNLGVYQIDLIVDERLFFTVKMDTFSYDEFNDNFIAYNKTLWMNKNKIYHHLFQTPWNKLPFYPLSTDGILDLAPGKHSVTINVLDNSGNKSTLSFNINYKSTLITKRPELKTIKSLSKDGLCSITIEKEDLYYPIQPQIEIIPSKRIGELIPVSNIYNIKPKEAVFKKATINFGNFGDSHQNYYYGDGKWKYMDKDTITDFTKFALFKDTTPPSINIISRHPIFRARIEDNGSGLDYDKLALYINGKKVIAEYSVNRKELFYKMPKGKHKITCIAVDKAGNKNQKHLTNGK